MTGQLVRVVERCGLVRRIPSLAIGYYSCSMRLWRGHYVMRMAMLVPFFLVSQLIAWEHRNASAGRLVLAALLGLLAAAAGWVLLTTWRHFRGRHPGESAS